MFIPAVFTFNLGTEDVAYLASPFVDGPSNTASNLQTMDMAYLASPFVTYWKY